MLIVIMNRVDFTLRLHHSNCTPEILNKWFRIAYMDLLNDDIFHLKKTITQTDKVNRGVVIFIHIKFYTFMNKKEVMEKINLFTLFENIDIYTIYNQPVDIHLTKDMILFNKEECYLNERI